ncbi:MAG TPA: CsbD family protein [Thermoanaerobaculia bacterium]
MASGAEHRGKGIVEQVKGAVKEGYGALTGDRSTEIEGKAERAKGAIRESYGKLKDDVTNDNDLNKPPR